MINKRLLGIKDDLYAKSFLCGYSIYVNSCYVSSNDNDNDESYHFEIVATYSCLEFMNYLYDFADDVIIHADNGFIRIKVVFS